MTNNDYITILSPMVTCLKLKGNDLIIFALVHGFTKDGQHEFSGSLDYISKWTNLSRASVISVLSRLTERGLLNKWEKVINGVKFCQYTTNYDEILAASFNNLTSSKETILPVKKLDRGGKETLPNNNSYNNRNITVIEESAPKLVKFQAPTYEEVREYVAEHGYRVDAQTFVDFYTSKGWMVGANKMKDWRAAVRNWNRTEADRRGGSSKRAPRTGSKFGDMLQVGAQIFGGEAQPDEQ